MDTKKISFINIMEVGLVRKKILGYLPNFKDIYCIASTCWELNQFITNEKITRNILYDYCQFNIKLVKINDKREFINVQEDSKFEGYVFENLDVLFAFKTKESEQYRRKRFICNDTVEIAFLTEEREDFRQKYVPFIKKLAQKYKINFEERKDLTILKLHDKNYNNSSIRLLHVLPYLYHENINTIIIPINYFSTFINKYNGLLNNLFNGFPKLYKLEFHISFCYIKIRNLIFNKDAIGEILRQLSKKNNATVHFKYFDDFDDISLVIKCFLLFLEFAMKYGIKITIDDETLRVLKFHNIPNILKRYNYSIEQHVTTCMDVIGSLHSDLHNCFKKMRYYENLEKVCLIFNYSLYDCSLEENFKAFRYIQSLNNLKKVVGLELTFVKHNTGISEDEIKIFHKNFKYLIRLLPSSVKRLYLYGIPKLTYDITKTIERYMPNIEVLSLYNISFEESDCLSVFKKLQAVAIRSDIPVKIPDSVKLFAVYTRESAEKDINQKLTNEYSKKFSKRLIVRNVKNIFFNDINDFRLYRHLIQIESILKHKNYFKLT
uniref:F-box domain-containing protein n=1 Tax=Strongyloides papillosus TaxID=174720 RepID=A0A0N5BVA6_STREA